MVYNALAIVCAVRGETRRLSPAFRVAWHLIGMGIISGGGALTLIPGGVSGAGWNRWSAVATVLFVAVA